VDKIFKLSHPRYQEKNLSDAINILLQNSYPIDFICKTILIINISTKLHITKKFFKDNSDIIITRADKSNSTVIFDKEVYLSKMQNMLSDPHIYEDNRIKHIISNSNSPETPSQGTTSPCLSFFTIPYIKNFSEKFFTLTKNLDKTLAFTVKNKLNTVVKLHKDSLAKMHQSNIVYKLCCNNCEASYVDQTKRQLMTRIKEHEKNINQRDEDLNVISLHKLQGHEFNWNEAIILDKEPSYKKRIISEMLYITQQNHGLNIQSDTDKLDKIYLSILNKCQ